MESTTKFQNNDLNLRLIQRIQTKVLSKLSLDFLCFFFLRFGEDKLFMREVKIKVKK